MEKIFFPQSIIQTLCDGVIDGYTVKMKIVFSHFPITVKLEGKKVLIENFQGEKAPRISRIWGKSKVTPKGDDLIITGPVLNRTQTTASSMVVQKPSMTRSI